MYIYIYLCMYICINTYINVCIFMYVYKYKWYRYLDVYMHRRIYIFIYRPFSNDCLVTVSFFNKFKTFIIFIALFSVSFSLFPADNKLFKSSTYINIYMYIYIYIYIYICIQIHIYIYVYTNLYIYVYIHLHTYISIYTCILLMYIYEYIPPFSRSLVDYSIAYFDLIIVCLFHHGGVACS
jgi:hypothetical protein